MKFGIRLHVIVRETAEEAWADADRLISHLDDETIAAAQKIFARMDSEGQRRMAELHKGDRTKLEISPNLWAGIGLVRGGAGTALVGDPEAVAARMKEYADLGIETFIFSGYPHLEEAYRTAELLFPHLPLKKDVNRANETANYVSPFGELIANTELPKPTKGFSMVKTNLPKSLGKQLLPWVLPIVLIVLWQLLGQFGVISTRILSTPTAVFTAGVHLAQKGTLFEYIGASSKRAFIGFAIGGSIGFVLGLINGLIPILEKITDTSVQMLRNIPHLAMIPLVILWFGIGEEGKLFLVALGVFFPIYLNTFHGIRSVDPGLIEMGRVYGLRHFHLFRKVIVPGALPLFWSVFASH